MKLTEISRSTWAKVAIGLTLFLAGYYFPVFGLLGTATAPSPRAIAPAPVTNAAGSQAQR